MSISPLLLTGLGAAALLLGTTHAQEGRAQAAPALAPQPSAPAGPSTPAHLRKDPTGLAQSAGDACDILLFQPPNGLAAFWSDESIEDLNTPVQIIAEDLTLPSDKVVCDLTIWGYFELTNGSPPGGFELIVHEDAMGLPGPAVYTESGVAVSSVLTGNVVNGFEESAFTLTPAGSLLLSAGTTYWIEVFFSASPGTDDFLWVTGDVDTSSGSGGLTFAVEAPGSTWIENLNDMSIQVRGSDPVDPCDTPDDFLEDNDDCGQEIVLGDGTYPGLFVSKTDWDYFSLTVAPGDTLDISVFHSQAEGDIDAFLYAADSCADFASGDVGCAGSLDCAFTFDDIETLTYTNVSGDCETYILKINVWPPTATGDCNSYDLLVSGTVGDVIGSSYCDQNANSTGQIARLTALGSDLPEMNQLTLVANRMPANQIGYFIVSQTAGLVDLPFLGISDGFLCLGSGKGRYNGINGNPGAILNSGDAGTFCLSGLDTTLIPLSSGMSYPAMSGTSNYFTAWFRDPSGTVGNNFTDAVEITWGEVKK